MAKLNSDDRKKRRKKKRKNKDGVCPRYVNAKVRYRSKTVAEYSRRILEKDNPGETFVAFKCDRGSGCTWVHIGRVIEDDEMEIL